MTNKFPLVALLFLAGCPKSADGCLGVKWGDDANQVVAKLHLSGGTWTPWNGGEGFETYSDWYHPLEIFSHQAFVELVRNGERLAGMRLFFMPCDVQERRALERDVRREFDISANPDYPDDFPYATFSDESVVHFEADSTRCAFTLTNGEFGK